MFIHVPVVIERLFIKLTSTIRYSWFFKLIHSQNNAVFLFCWPRVLQEWSYRIDDYAKDGWLVEAWHVCSFSHEPLRTWIKTNVNNWICLNLTSEYELQILPNTKVTAVKDHGESYMKVRPPLVRHLLHNRLLTIPLRKVWDNLGIFCGGSLPAQRFYI